MSQESEENVALMEPMMPSHSNSELDDMVIEVVAKGNKLSGKLNPTVQKSVADLLRSMNCYYSNLIEGHDTHPRDINRALLEDYSSEPVKRALQKEAVAHIEVQRMIDLGKDLESDPLSKGYVEWLHKEFCDRLPDELLWVENPDTKEKVKVIPGVFRDRTVTVGRHIPPRPENLNNFMKRFEEAYSDKHLSKSKRIISAAAAHHRLLWIHPFIDGNGRVARLMSYSLLLKLGVGNTLWSVARGLARESETYKRLLQQADSNRQGDLDGRGTLSENGLAKFCEFFLKVCIDQIEYMASLLNTNELLRRMQIYIDEEIAAKRLPKGSFQLLREALLAGEYARGQAPEIVGYKERSARAILSKLLSKGLLVSDDARGPVRLGFPIEAVERWFPLLYPDVKM